MKCSIHSQYDSREIPEHLMEPHHLVPNKTRGQKRPKGPTILVCMACGDQLHLMFTNKQLAKQLNTLEKLLANEKVDRWARWIAKKKDLSVCMKRLKKN